MSYHPFALSDLSNTALSSTRFQPTCSDVAQEAVVRRKPVGGRYPLAYVVLVQPEMEKRRSPLV